MKNIFLLLCIFIISLQADTITFTADEWCPYNCDPKSDHPGYMIEIAQKVFKKKGHTIVYTGGISWAKAVLQTRKGLYNGVVGAYKLDTPDFIFPSLAQGISKSVFVVKNSNPWDYTGIDSLENKTLGYIKGYNYSNELNAYIKKYYNYPQKVQAVSGNHAILYNAKKLLYEKIDTFIEDQSVLEYYFHLNREDTPFRIAGNVLIDKVYISFSPNNEKSKEYADILSKGMQELRKTGELKIILQRYGLKDWE